MANGNTNNTPGTDKSQATFLGWISKLDSPTAIIVCLLLLTGNKGLGVLFPELSRPDAFTATMYDDAEKLLKQELEKKLAELKRELESHSDANRREMQQHINDRLSALSNRVTRAQAGVDAHDVDAARKIREYDQRLARLEATHGQNGREGN